jgi:hypothetical protein
MATPCIPSDKIPINDRKWGWFLAVPCIIYAIFLVIIFFFRTGKLAAIGVGNKRKRNQIKNEDDDDEYEYQPDQGWYIDLKEGAGHMVSAQTLQGRILVVLSFVFNMAGMALYVVDSNYPIEHCFDAGDQILWRIEICLNTFFIFHFVIRLLAANDKLLFLIQLETVTDILTVPSTFISLVIGRNWLGLRFLRIVYMKNLADILQFLNVLHSGSSIEVAEIIGQLMTNLLASAGFVHLFENTGDPWGPISNSNANPINYFTSIYFLIVTMSTVRLW